MKGWHLVLIGILFSFLAIGVILVVAKPIQGTPITLLPAPTQTPLSSPSPSATPTPIKVQITGQVVSAGIYDIDKNSRLEDLIQKAGGLTISADESRINLAALLRDGDYFYIPSFDESIPETAANAPKNIQTRSETLDYPINLNTASQEELESLPGIGPTKATDILVYRDEVGSFSSIDELLNVTGIGPSTLESILDYITIEP